MNTTKRRVLSAAVLGLVAATTVACSRGETTAPAEPAGLETLRDALVPFTSPALAHDAGYATAITDCMSNGDEGAMGVHIANVDYVDATVDAAHPEALIYEPGTGGAMSLVGVEFIVPFTAVPRSGTAPTLFGQRFQPNAVFGVWALHVWTHRANPSGLFATWNPRVHC